MQTMEKIFNVICTYLFYFFSSRIIYIINNYIFKYKVHKNSTVGWMNSIYIIGNAFLTKETLPSQSEWNVHNFALPVRAANMSVSEKIIARGESRSARNVTYALSASEGISAGDLTWLLKGRAILKGINDSASVRFGPTVRRTFHVLRKREKGRNCLGGGTGRFPGTID